MQRFPTTESSYWDTTLLGSHPLNSFTTPPLTIQKIEWEDRSWAQVLKITFAENIKYNGGIYNAMHFNRFAENAENKHESDAEAFFYFISKLNQPIQIPIRCTFLDEQGFIYWVLSDEVIEEISAERNKWHSLGYSDSADYCLENKELIEQGVGKEQNWTDIHLDFAKKDYWGGKTYQKLWEEQNFNQQQAKKWIKLGLNPKEYELAVYSRQRIHQPQLVLDLEKLRKEFKTWYKNLPAQEYLDYFYPKEQRTQVERLDFRNDKSLTSIMDLRDFANLKRLDCRYNQLTSLKLDNCLRLEGLDCNNNCLQALTLPSQEKQLTYLKINDNNLPTQDLSIFKKLVNLKILWIGNYNQEKINQGIYNRFTGSLEPLKNMNKLEILGISNTDIDSGLEYLTEDIKHLSCSADEKKDAKCQVIFYLFSSTQGKWTSGNPEIDRFIKECQLRATNLKESLEWIPHEQLTEIEYLAEGGFGKIHKAKWNNKNIALKSLNNSQNIKTEFLQEIANYKLFINSKTNRIVQCYGISHDPETKNYLMVMDYIKDGDLRKFLRNNRLNLENKIAQLWRIAEGLNQIHKQELTHQDFHSGNILNRKDKKSGEVDVQCYITDLGLCRPANEKDKGEKYGVMPYVAPEVLRGQPYTQASDIYSFGMVAYEVLTGLPPYYDREHDVSLALEICDEKELRPQFQIKVPQLLEDLIKQCWGADPKKRPTASELKKDLNNWWKEINKKKDTKFTKQLQAAEEHNKSLPDEVKFPKYQIHQGASYHSKLLPTKEITQLLYGSKDIDLDINDFESNHPQSNKEAKDLATQTKRQLSLESQAKTNQGEAKQFKTTETECQSEPTQINPNQTWTHHHFTAEQAQEWINLNPPTQQNQARQEPSFYAWLRDTKNLTPEKVLNNDNLNSLRQEFIQSQQQAHIQQINRPNN